MPQQSRIDTAGAMHHIMVRDGEGSKVFRSDTDRDHFLERLGGILPETHTIWYWAVRELGIPLSNLSIILGISIPSVSMSVKRGQRIAEENEFTLLAS